MQVSIFFLQAFANVMNGKLPLREDDFLNLAALKMCSEKTRTSINDLSKTPLSNYIPLNIVQAQSPITPNQMISIIKESNLLHSLL
jgi:hypothetical protein